MRWSGDRGQAFPIYIAALGGLLFVALALFVVGQASVSRSDAQGAADAAALAAAQEARDNLLPGVDLTSLQGKGWEQLLNGVGLDGGDGCDAAGEFASRNSAQVVSCLPSRLSFSVEVKTEQPVGKSVVPGTEGVYGTAGARAAIVPRCRLGQPATPEVTPSPSGGVADKPGGEVVDKPGPIKIRCKGGKELAFDPAKPDPWKPLARKLFDVRLKE
ncbi:pilus assembly protein TadG-related protein [Streptomyces sp. NPDC059851]|uniref:pilus assembly protein TadG-related protein n=1 Tax=Streptomyces sp. NPDC059851 TaxID=3346971 RepID=UPI0036506DB3